MENKKIKYQFNIVDFLIIIAIVAVIIFAVNIIISEVFTDTSVDVEYTLTINGVSQKDLKKIKVGDTLYSALDGSVVGNVTSVSSHNQLNTFYSPEDNRFVEREDEYLYTVNVTLNTKCVFEKHMYMVGKNIISTNRTPSFNIPFEYSDCEITNVHTETANKEVK